ncbi:MAG: acyl-CoA dehydrogenase [Deltaproteobacteria bacterium]|nr:acyl-CoA dehydrogenase [Deltaproteobacteria bacterium]
MDLGFTSEQNVHRQFVAEFLAKECPYEFIKEIEESEEGYSKKKWAKMAELGWTLVYLPEEYGGFDDPSFMDLLIIMEELGKAAVPSPFFSTVIQCGLVILEGASEDQKNTLLPEMASGNLIMALAQYEEEASYKETGINMSAEDKGDCYRLSGTKLFVADANIADKLIVAARVKDAGVTLLLVDAKDPGITVTKMPTVGMDNICEVIFKDVNVPADQVIGRPGGGWEILEKMFPKATVAKCGEMLGGASAAIEMTAAYVKQRVQYGKPIGGFQAIQHFMADMQLAYDTSSNYLYKVAWMIEEEMEATKEVSSLKAKVNEDYKFVAERAVHLHGGIGTTREGNVGLFYRRAKAFEFAMGDTGYHCEIVAQALGL